MQLLDWLDQVTFPEEKKYRDLEYARRVYDQVVRRTLDAGVCGLAWTMERLSMFRRLLAVITRPCTSRRAWPSLRSVWKKVVLVRFELLCGD